MYDPRYWPTFERLIALYRDPLYRIEDAQQRLVDLHARTGQGRDERPLLLEMAGTWLNTGRTEEARDLYDQLKRLARGEDQVLRAAAALGLDLCRPQAEDQPTVRRSLEMIARLGQFHTRASEKQWPAALQALNEILENHSDAVLEGSSILAISARECVRQELARLSAEGTRAYKELYADPLKAATCSRWSDVVEQFRYVHPFGPFERTLDEAIADRLLAEGRLSRAAGFYERAMLVRASTDRGNNDAKLAAKAAFCRALAGEPAEVPQLGIEPVKVAGEQKRLRELVHAWQRDAERAAVRTPAFVQLDELKHSRLPLTAAPRVMRKWQAGSTHGKRKTHVSMAVEFVPYVPAGDAGGVFFNTSETVHAFDPQRGRLMWTRGPSEANAADPPPRSLKGLTLAACAKRFCCATSSDAVFYRLNWGHRATDARRSAVFAARREDGALLWSTEHQPDLALMEFVSDPTYANGTVVAAAWEPREIPVFFLVGLDAVTGQLLWRTELFSGSSFPAIRGGRHLDTILSSAPPTVSGHVAYFCGGVGIIAAVDILDGSIKWLRDYPRRNVWGPDPWGCKFIMSRPVTPIAISGNWVIAIPQDASSLLVLDARDGVIKGRHESMDLRCLIGASGDRAYFQKGTSIAAIRPPEVEVLWERELDVSGILGSASLSPRGLVVPCWEGLYVLAPASGKIAEHVRWGPSEACGNVLDLGERLVGMSREYVHMLAPESFKEADWWLNSGVQDDETSGRRGRVGSQTAGIPDSSNRLAKWIMPAVGRGDCYFSLDAKDLMLLRAPDFDRNAAADPFAHAAVGACGTGKSGIDRVRRELCRAGVS